MSEKLTPGRLASICLTLWLVVPSCASRSLAYRDTRTKLIRLYHDNGQLAASGRASRHDRSAGLLCKFGDWSEHLRLGRWAYYYESGERMAEIEYLIDWVTECCVAGPCEQPYEVKVGDFSCWWPNGALLASGDFQMEEIHVATNCEGGDIMLTSKPSPSTQFFDATGTLTERSDLNEMPPLIHCLITNLTH